MAIQYSGTTIGTFTLWQKSQYYNDEKKLVDEKDDKGRQVWNKYKIQIRLGNCMAIFLHIYKEDEPKDPERPWIHKLMCFFMDEKHLQRCMKHINKEHFFEYMFDGQLHDIKLNLHYKDMQTLMKYMIRDGLKVTAYYKEPKEKKTKTKTAKK